MSRADDAERSGRSAPPGTERGPLRPAELATAAVLGAMTVVLVIAGWFLPHASAVTALGAVPMGVISFRHRPRAVVAGVVAATSVGFLVAGTGVISTIVLCGLIGGMAGHAHRRRWGLLRLLGAAAVTGPFVAAIAIGVLEVFASLRKLTLEQLRNTWRGLSGVLGRLLGALPGLHHAGTRLTIDLDGAVAWGIRNWWETVAVVLVVFTVFATLLAWYLLDIVFARLARVRATDRLAASDPVPAGTVTDPVPVHLSDVSVRYPGAPADALAHVDLAIAAGEMVAVLGPNGSGKSTLSRVLAGVAPTAGCVERPGGAGLGEPGGTAVVSQRPESQVLGVRVADDVVWGLPRDFAVDVAGLLASVGLAGMEGRETSGLSGGQLQRLAVAAALARRPRLLISDESTAMIDAGGRRRLVELLTALPRQRDMSVVHVTHRLSETLGADRILRLVAGRVAGDDTAVDGSVVDGSVVDGSVVDGSAGTGSAPDPGTVTDAAMVTDDGRVTDAGRVPGVVTGPAASSSRPVVLELRGVGHVYADGTPWAHGALRDIDLEVRSGEGILVVGGNGSGKSTLAWVLAGLLRPTFGDCLVHGRPVHTQVGTVAIAFQHSRLQVQRSTVGRDVRAAGLVDRDTAEAALRRVGLDPEVLWDRAVDELSGGQLRRVALAGLLTRTPDLLVLDEPLAGLDDDSRAGLIDLLAGLRRDHGMTLVVISHDLEGSGAICDRMIRLEAGAVTADGPMLPVTMVG